MIMIRTRNTRDIDHDMIRTRDTGDIDHDMIRTRDINHDNAQDA